MLVENLKNIMKVKKYNEWKVKSAQTIVDKIANNYQSITSIINARPNPSLEKWRKELGEDVADFEMQRCADRGNKTHLMIQEYFTTKYQYLYDSHDNKMPTSHMCDSVLANGMFMNILYYLELIKETIFVEQELYSDTYKIHGRVDCIGKIAHSKAHDIVTSDSGYWAIIDFKTSKTPKQSIRIEHGVQLTAYAVMFNEMFNANITDIVIINADEMGGSQIIRRNIKDFMPTFEEWCVF